jgi:hydrogenase nickel incorporation protein HypA/HybF
MHEMALVRDVVDIVVDKAQEVGASKVCEVYLTIGYMRDVVEDIMDGLFRYLARGTVAEDADLIISRVPITVCCNQCGGIFNINIYKRETWKCPFCGAVHDYELRSGREFYVNHIEIEMPEDNPPAIEAAQARG